MDANIQAASHDLKERQSHPAITITRQTGARAISIGIALLKELETLKKAEDPQWTLFEKNLIERVLNESHYEKSLSRFFHENPSKYIADTVEEIVGLHPPAQMINQKCHELIQLLCAKGHVVVIGRCGNMITSNMKNVLKIRLMGSFQVRVKHMINYSQLSEKMAITYLKKEDNSRRQYAKENFSIVDINNPLHYDLVINTDNLSDNTVADTIVSLLRKSKNI